MNKEDPENSPNARKTEAGSIPKTNLPIGLPGTYGIKNREIVQHTQKPERAIAPYTELLSTVVM